MKTDSFNDEKTYVLVFDAGDEPVSGILEFATSNNLASSHFTAIGGFSEVKLGYFDLQEKDCVPIAFRSRSRLYPWWETSP